MKLYRTTSGHTVLDPKVNGLTGELKAIRLFNGKKRCFCFEHIKTNAKIARALNKAEASAVISNIKRLVNRGIQLDEERIAEK